MVRINKIEDVSVELYSPDNKLIGTIENILQFLDVRVQIMEQKLDNYYIKIGNEEYEIDSNGRVINYPKGLFDTMDKFLDKLLRL